MLAIVGYQGMLFWLLTKIYGQREGFTLPRGRLVSTITERVTTESSALVGALSFLVGLGILVAQLVIWAGGGFGALDPTDTMRLAVPAALLMILGAQTIMSGMFIGILSIDLKK